MRSNAYEALRSLGDDVMAEIDRKLHAGMSPAMVATWLQKGLGQLAGMKFPTLRNNLHRYRERELRPQLDALAELSDLANKQKSRLDRLLASTEALPGGSLSGEARAETALLADMFADLGKLQAEGEDGPS